MTEAWQKPAAPANFAFTAANLEKANAFVARYPQGRQQSAVMPLLDLAQRQLGWLPPVAIEYVARFLDMPRIRVQEVASFYTMYRLRPVGRHVVQVCTTTPCWLRDCDAIVETCRRKLGVELGGTTQDGRFTLLEVECLGACVNAPMLQIDDDYYEDLTPETTERVLEAFARGEKPKPGPQGGRRASEPAGGPTTLAKFAKDA